MSMDEMYRKFDAEVTTPVIAPKFSDGVPIPAQPHRDDDEDDMPHGGEDQDETAANAGETEASVAVVEDADSIDGAALLDRVRAALEKYVKLPDDESADAVTLWIAATHAVPAWEHATRLGITAPEKRCGKTRLLDVMEALVYRPIVAFNATVAAIYRSIDAEDPPTLLFDEYDAIFGSKRAAENNEDLRALLNAGHGRGKPMLRCSGPNSDVKAYPSFAMVALAGIGDLPDTVADRAVIVRMRRRLPGEHVDSFRVRRDVPGLHRLRDELTKWARKHIGELKLAEPDMPVEDRAADTWESLVAIADLAGSDWPMRARAAAKKFNGIAEEADAAQKLTTRLLADLRTVFGEQEKMHGESILTALHKIDGGGWDNFFGRPFNARDLADKLRPYGVAPRDVKINGSNKKGYRRDDLWDVWSRYLPPLDDAAEADGSSATTATQATSQVSPVALATAVADASATATSSATGLTSHVAEVAPVAHTWPANEGGDCARCGVRTHKYGPGGSPLCADCRAANAA